MERTYLLLALSYALLSAHFKTRILRPIVSFTVELYSAFLNFKAGDSIEDRAVKVASVVVRRTIYVFVDYWLAALSLLIVVVMKRTGFSFLFIFLATWVYDIIVSAAFVLIYAKTGKDLALGQDFRRAADVIRTRSRLLGYLVSVGVAAWAVFWDGPEKVVTYFWKELKTFPMIAGVLVVLSAFQAIIWTSAYSFGYDLIFFVWKAASTFISNSNLFVTMF